jgi:AcrR family transcriptional regulator
MTNPPSRPEEIIAHAIELAEDRGVTGVTTATLARRLGFTEAALYRYFPAKGAILGAALQHLGEQLFATMLLELRPEALSDLSSFGAQMGLHAGRFASRQGLLLELLLSAASGRDSALQQAADAFLQEYTHRLVAYFSQVQELEKLDRSVTPTELARRWVCQLLGGFVRCRISLDHWDPMVQPGYDAFVEHLRASSLFHSEVAIG